MEPTWVPPSEPIIQLTTPDQGLFTLPRRFTTQSSTLSTVLELDPQAQSIPVNLTRPVLGHVVTYLNLQAGERLKAPITKPLRSNRLSENMHPDDVRLAQWLHDVITLDFKLLEDLSSAAAYLGLDDLIHLCCAKKATYIKNQDVTQMEKILDPSSENAVRKHADHT